jgi:hypothetical protein
MHGEQGRGAHTSCDFVINPHRDAATTDLRETNGIPVCLARDVLTPCDPLCALRLSENSALEAECRARLGCSRCEIPSGTDSMMTWLEMLLVVPLLLIALGLTR